MGIIVMIPSHSYRPVKERQFMLRANEVRHSHDQFKEDFLTLLAHARLPAKGVKFSVRKTHAHAGEERSGITICEQGHEVTMSMRDLREWIANKFFNDVSVVPYLCPHCAYPDIGGPSQKKATVFHRLAILRKKYPKVHYLEGFSTTGKEMEFYSCGETFADGTPHPYFSIRYDKLVAVDRAGKLRHCCYICGLLNGEVPETKTKTLEMLSARMKLITELLGNNRTRRWKFTCAVTKAGDEDGPLSTSKSLLRFSCGNPGHETVIRTADNYFKASRGGFCGRCLAEHGIKSTAEIFDHVCDADQRRYRI
jgi:hypothetical protein